MIKTIKDAEQEGVLENCIYNADCLDLMPHIKSKSIDMILCDLPYNTTACHWDKLIPFEPLWEQYKRIIKDNGAIVLTASQPFTSALVMSNIKMFKYEWIWDKKLPTGHLNAKRMPLKRHENILVFGKGNLKYIPQIILRENIREDKAGGIISDGTGKSAFGKHSKVAGKYTHRQPTTIQEFSNANKTNVLHPTQKPVALFEYLIKTYTNEGDLVLDNCAGSGTTGVASKNLNRNYILIEKEPEYIKIIKERLNY
jgi:site-specific DNA-methyltransferase (adenine-specific)